MRRSLRRPLRRSVHSDLVELVCAPHPTAPTAAQDAILLGPGLPRRGRALADAEPPIRVAGP
ncbi:MAG: hypothetical protein AB8H79_04960 [Myxococcota bacterium]